jgi:hypothetical protein
VLVGKERNVSQAFERRGSIEPECVCKARRLGQDGPERLGPKKQRAVDVAHVGGHAVDASTSATTASPIENGRSRSANARSVGGTGVRVGAGVRVGEGVRVGPRVAVGAGVTVGGTCVGVGGASVGMAGGTAIRGAVVVAAAGAFVAIGAAATGSAALVSLSRPSKVPVLTPSTASTKTTVAKAPMPIHRRRGVRSMASATLSDRGRCGATGARSAGSWGADESGNAFPARRRSHPACRNGGWGSSPGSGRRSSPATQARRSAASARTGGL